MGTGHHVKKLADIGDSKKVEVTKIRGQWEDKGKDIQLSFLGESGNGFHLSRAHAK